MLRYPLYNYYIRTESYPMMYDIGHLLVPRAHMIKVVEQLYVYNKKCLLNQLPCLLVVLAKYTHVVN